MASSGHSCPASVCLSFLLSSVCLPICLSFNPSPRPDVYISICLPAIQYVSLSIYSICLSIYSICLSICVPVLLSACSSARCLPVSLSVYCLPICLSVLLAVCLPSFLSVRLSACLSVCLYICLPSHLPAFPSGCLPICLPASRSACLSVCLPLGLPVYLSTCLHSCLLIHHSIRFCLSVNLPNFSKNIRLICHLSSADQLLRYSVHTLRILYSSLSMPCLSLKNTKMKVLTVLLPENLRTCFEPSV